MNMVALLKIANVPFLKRSMLSRKKLVMIKVAVRLSPFGRIYDLAAYEGKLTRGKILHWLLGNVN